MDVHFTWTSCPYRQRSSAVTGREIPSLIDQLKFHWALSSAKWGLLSSALSYQPDNIFRPILRWLRVDDSHLEALVERLDWQAQTEISYPLSCPPGHENTALSNTRTVQARSLPVLRDLELKESLFWKWDLQRTMPNNSSMRNNHLSDETVYHTVVIYTSQKS